MSDIGTFQQGIINWVRTYGSNDWPAQLPEGVVNWFNRQRPFISDTLDVGLYCRLVSFKSPGRAGRVRSTVTTAGTEYARTVYHSNDKVRLQVQAISLNDTDEDSALTYLSNLSGRCWTDESLADLLALNASIVSKADVQLTSAPLDDRTPTVGTFELVLHLHSDVLGLDVPFVQSVTGTGHATNGAGTIPPQTFEVSE
jgi:hypothetical protein